MSTATATNLTPETVEQAANAVAKIFGVTAAAILGTRRHAEVVEARFALLHLLHEDAGESSPRVGKALGRDHTNVLWGVSRAKELASAYPLYAARLKAAGESFAAARRGAEALHRGRMPWL